MRWQALLVLLLAVLLANSPASRVHGLSPSLTHIYESGSVFYDMGNNLTELDFTKISELWDLEISDVSMPLDFIGLRSGWDMRQVHIAYDLGSDTAYFGIVFYGIAGDADGDGNASVTSTVLSLLGGSDLPVRTFFSVLRPSHECPQALGGSENIMILIDTGHHCNQSGCVVLEFNPSLVIGKPSHQNRTNFTISDYGVYQFYGLEGDLIQLNIHTREFVSPLAYQPTDPMETLLHSYPPSTTGNTSTPLPLSSTRADFEVAVANFSRLPGMSRTSNGALQFSFVAYAGSNDDQLITYDLIPDVAPVDSSSFHHFLLVCTDLMSCR